MRKFSIAAIFALFLLAGCGGSGGPQAPVVPDACSVDSQKQFVLDKMRDVYLWNDLLPADVDLSSFATPEDLLDFLISYQALDNFSYIDTAVADAQFFGAGQYEGYGFSSRFEATGDLRLVRVFASSPANAAGFDRGQRILNLNGRTIADIEANEGVGELFALPGLEFTIERLDGSLFTVNVDRGLVTIDPLPQHRIIDRPDGTSVGYVELATFVSTADAAFATVFNEFQQANVADVIIDLRYNGGGLVSTTELLGDFLGGAVSENLVFSKTLFNANNAAFNRIAFFQRLTESIDLSRLVVVATDRTASASELLTNSMEAHAEVSIVGSTTLGKPVGQLGIEFCDKILRPTAFETVNADDEGGYFSGLTADCPVRDDLSVPVGDDADPNLIAALSYLDTGACPPVANDPSGNLKSRTNERSGKLSPSGKVWNRIAYAW